MRPVGQKLTSLPARKLPMSASRNIWPTTYACHLFHESMEEMSASYHACVTGHRDDPLLAAPAAESHRPAIIFLVVSSEFFDPQQLIFPDVLEVLLGRTGRPADLQIENSRRFAQADVLSQW